MALNRLPSTPGAFGARAAAAAPPANVPATPEIAALPAIRGEEAPQAHEPAHRPHAHPKLPHGPTPRPRRPARPGKTRRRKRNAAASPDDDSLDLADAHAHDPGVAAVAFDGQQRDGGDDDAEGGDERSRQDRLGRVRRLADAAAESSAAAPGAAPVQRLPPLHRGAQARLAVERFAQRACDVVAQGAPDMGLQLKRLKLALLLETPGVRRLDRGGLARVKQLLAACMPRSLARRARPPDAAAAARIAHGHLMLVMMLLQLQRPMTPAQRAESIARLTVQVHGHPHVAHP